MEQSANDSSMVNKIRLNAVSFLNTRPLTFGLEYGGLEHEFEITYNIPSVCAQQVSTGESSAGIIPSIEYARSSVAYSIVPNVAIASSGPVGSILLFHKVPVNQIRKVAMDVSSRTSIALAQIILNERYQLNFDSIDLPPDVSMMLELADAALVIGDPALENTDRPEPRLDLGEAWQELTGLPFVYAFWAGKENFLSPNEVELLIKSKDRGVNALDEIAEAHAENHTHTSSFYTKYLRDNLTYNLGDLELKGLLKFYELAQIRGLISEIPELRFYTRSVRR